jgi:hypothetical protein
VRKGSLQEANPHERSHFFAFARETMGIPACVVFFVGFISSFFTSKGEFNIVFLTLILTAAVLFVLTLKFKKRQEVCEAYKEHNLNEKLLVFSTGTLVSSIPVGLVLGFIVYSFLILRR